MKTSEFLQGWKFFDGLHLWHHPDWSPSAIKSALMMIAWKFFDGLHREAEFAYGSGHINPLMATDPGLVYETPIEEYLKLWCSLSRTTGS
ncbi:peptidase S8, subtilisin-related protein [Artemisia annua]|uniref:Peptidase S8, subtilisin-related protein n=1 Tax=Artemisia annua TaxID=35608 RepID=A0A2U1QIA9_ARTAN|nr:peptidase S8, subtilisin-related protein [Artemisia annua]